MKHQLTGNSGLFYIAWQLSRRGWHAIPTVRNARGSDLYAANDDESRVLTIQSKALSKKSDVPLGGSLDSLRSEWWIITLGANDPEPVCSIMTLTEVKAAAVMNTNGSGIVSWWLPSKVYMQPQFCDAWDRLSD